MCPWVNEEHRPKEHTVVTVIVLLNNEPLSFCTDVYSPQRLILWSYIYFFQYI